MKNKHDSLFYDTKSYDKESFEATLKKYPDIQMEYIRPDWCCHVQDL